MKITVKWFSLILSISLLLSLCLAPAAFATGTAERSPTPSSSVETMEGTDPAQDSGESTPPLASPSDSMESSLPPDGGEQPTPPPDPAEEDPPTTAPSDPIESDPPQPEEPGDEAPPVTDTAATAEELRDWFKAHYIDGGTLYLTKDICLDDDSDLQWVTTHARMTIEAGEFSLIAVGEVSISGALTIRGKGGEKGVLRAAEGGRLTIGGLTVEASEGCAIVQEEGSSLIVDKASACTVIGEIHYAETPFVLSWGEQPQVVVAGPGQTAADVLPTKVMAAVVQNGAYTVEPLPVIWDLSEHEAEDEQRLRFKVTGESADTAYLSPPFYTVVYNDFPLTFTSVETMLRRGNYLISGGFTKPIGRLPITVAQEYSFDNLTWQPYKELDVPDEACEFFFSITEDDWDTQSNPELYIRLRWDDDGTEYYSNVLSFNADNLNEERDNGGNRGGGTDITDPPGVPEPDPEPEPPDHSGGGLDGGGDESQNPSDHSGDGESENPSPPDHSGGGDGGKPDTTLPGNSGDGGSNPPDNFWGGDSVKPDPTPDPTPNSTPNPSGSSDNGGNETPAPPPEQTPPSSEPTPAPPMESAPPAAAATPPKETTEPPAVSEAPWDTPPTAEPETTPDAPTSDKPEDTASVPPAESESVDALAPSEPDAAPKGPGALPIAVGCTAVAGTIGAAGLYLHPKALKELLKMLRKIIPKK